MPVKAPNVFNKAVHCLLQRRINSVSMLTYLSCHYFSNPINVAFPIANLRFISLSHLASLPLLNPQKRKACYYFYFLSVYLKAVPIGCCHNLCLLYVEI